MDSCYLSIIIGQTYSPSCQRLMGLTDRKNMHGGSSWFSISFSLFIIYALKRDLIAGYHGHAPPVTEPTIAVTVSITLTAIQSMHRHACASGRWKPPNARRVDRTSPHSIRLLRRGHYYLRFAVVTAPACIGCCHGTVIQIKQAMMSWQNIHVGLTAPFFIFVLKREQWSRLFLEINFRNLYCYL
jgi:hypothetical protein